MVGKEDCEREGKFYVEGYKRDDGTFVKSHCRKFRIGEEPEYLAWKKKQEKERNERMKELDENQDEGMELSEPEPVHDPAPEPEPDKTEQVIWLKRYTETQDGTCPHGYEWVKPFKKRNGETVQGFCRKKHERKEKTTIKARRLIVRKPGEVDI